MEKLIDKINLIYGTIVALMTTIFGAYWYLFAAFLLLNVIDYITGYTKARIKRKESSKIGAKGIRKKLGYWIVIAVSFMLTGIFRGIGETIGINLSFVQIFGWMTLATYIINEIRSILENLVEIEIPVPQFLIKGLEVAAKTVENKTDNDT